MNKKGLILTFGLLLILVAGPSKAANLFEGEVDYEYTGGNNGATVNEYIKGGKIRLDSRKSGQESSVIIDLVSRNAWVLMSQKKEFMEIAVPGPGKNPWAVPTTFVKTGETEKILDYPCQEWACKTDQGQTSVWLTTGLGAFGGIGILVNTSDVDWVKKMETQGFFPLKIAESDKDGKLKGTLTAAKIAKKTPSPDLFQIPSDYKKTDLKAAGLGGPSMRPTPQGKK